MHRGARTDCCTKKARTLAQSFYKLDAIPPNVRKMSLDELDKVEAHLNEGSPVSSWLGIHVYEPERLLDGEVAWHLRINPNPKLKKILTIGVYEGHAFLIKDITKLAKTYSCSHCWQRFTQSCHLQRHHQTCKGNSNLLPWDKSGSATDSLQESDVPPEGLTIRSSGVVAGARSEALENPHPPRNAWAWG